MATPTPPPTFNPYGTANRHVAADQDAQRDDNPDVPAVANPQTLVTRSPLKSRDDGKGKKKNKTKLSKGSKIAVIVIMVVVVASLVGGGWLMFYGPQPELPEEASAPTSSHVFDTSVPLTPSEGTVI